MQTVKQYRLIGLVIETLPPLLTTKAGFEIAGIASQFATQFRPVATQCVSSVALIATQV